MAERQLQKRAMVRNQLGWLISEGFQLKDIMPHPTGRGQVQPELLWMFKIREISLLGVFGFSFLFSLCALLLVCCHFLFFSPLLSSASPVNMGLGNFPLFFSFHISFSFLIFLPIIFLFLLSMYSPSFSSTLFLMSFFLLPLIL